MTNSSSVVRLSLTNQNAKDVVNISCFKKTWYIPATLSDLHYASHSYESNYFPSLIWSAAKQFKL